MPGEARDFWSVYRPTRSARSTQQWGTFSSVPRWDSQYWSTGTPRGCRHL